MCDPKNRLFPLFICFLFTSLNCSDSISENTTVLNDELRVTSFQILSENNSGISRDILGFIDRKNKRIRFRNPHLSSNKLVATFNISKNSNAYVNNDLQESNITVIDYSKPVEFSIVSEEGKVAIWKIEMTREIVNLKEFLSICPTEDPNIDLILSDFNILLNGELVTEFPCQVPYYMMSNPTSESLDNEYYTETTRLQSLRFLFYLDYDNPIKLPWSDLRLYDWLKDGMGGIKILDGKTGGSCCGWIDGEFYITVGNIRTAPAQYVKSSHELLTGFSLMSIGLTLHERRHMDGFHHTSGCCENSSACDLKLDLKNPSAYGIMVWWNKAIWDNTYNFGQSCAYSSDQYWSANSKKILSPNRWSTYFCSGSYDFKFQQTQPICIYEN